MFRVRADGRDLVVRFGPYVEDFEKDRFAARFSCAAMPVPNVEVIRSAGDSFLAVSTRAPGIAPRRSPGPNGTGSCRRSSSCWKHSAVADPPGGGFGAWDGAGIAKDRIGATICLQSGAVPKIDVLGLVSASG